MGLSLEQATAIAGAVGLGGLLKTAADWWIRRRAKAERATADLTHANAEFQTAVAGAAKDLLKDYRDQLRYVRERCDGLETKIDACEARHADCEKKVAEMQQQIDLLSIPRAMADHPPADYAPPPLAGVVPPAKPKP